MSQSLRTSPPGRPRHPPMPSGVDVRQASAEQLRLTAARLTRRPTGLTSRLGSCRPGLRVSTQEREDA
jgi:hypothetical protein